MIKLIVIILWVVWLIFSLTYTSKKVDVNSITYETGNYLSHKCPKSRFDYSVIISMLKSTGRTRDIYFSIRGKCKELTLESLLNMEMQTGNFDDDIIQVKVGEQEILPLEFGIASYNGRDFALKYIFFVALFIVSLMFWVFNRKKNSLSKPS